jgi:3-phenylpropionate/trans-cinnamate dioxygenase ferredoxin component
MESGPEWVRAAAVADLDDDDVIEVIARGETIALYRSRGQYFATDGICSHEHALLADGYLDGMIIECPKHQGRFDIRTGAPKGAPACLPIRTYQVRVDGGDLCIDLGGVGLGSEP